MSTQFNFPANPTVGDQFTLPNGVITQWNGSEWLSVSDASANVTYPLPITLGGTAATTPSQARFNLGLNLATGEFVVQKDGTVTAPGITFASEPGLGWFWPAASTINVAAQGQRIFSIDASSSTLTSLIVNPRATGVAVLTLANQIGSAANYNVMNLSVQPSGHMQIAAGHAGTAGQGQMMCYAASYQFQPPDSSADTNVFINKASSGKNAVLYGTMAGSNRWAVLLGDSTTESGSNAGSNFVIQRQSDAGVYLDQPFSINRATGVISTNALVVVGGINLYTGNLVFNGGGSVNLQAGQQFPNIVMYPGGWQWVFSVATGDLFWQASGGANQFQIAYGGNLTIIGATAQKASGTTWANPSDRSIKHDITPYTPGLDELLRVQPRSYRLNDPPVGLDGPIDLLCQGIVADEVIEPFPQSITYTREGAALFNADPIFWAMVNAFKQINQRLKAIGA